MTSLACAVQASVGFGAALLAAPALLLIHPAFAPAPIIASNLLLTVLVARREWSSVDFTGLKFVVAGRIVGTIPAAGLLAVVSDAIFDALFGALVLAAVALSLVRGDVERRPRSLTLAGLASGLMGTLSSIGGPPVALVYQHASPAMLRSTLAVNLVIGASVSLLALRLVGRFGPVEIALAGILVPAALIGFWLSRFGILWVDAARVRVAVLVLSAAAALGVLWRAVAAAAA